jgi:methyl-accepting chemotaxis protein
MVFDLLFTLQPAVASARDTIVALTMPAERTAFDVASGTLELVVLLVGAVALVAVAVTALALKRVLEQLQHTVDRLAADAKPLLHQAARTAEEARDLVKRVRTEADRLAEATGAVSQRLVDIAEAAGDRLDQVNALLDVVQEEVQATALSAAAAVRGVRVGASSLGAALSDARGGAERRRRAGGAPRADEDADEDAEDADWGDAPTTMPPDDRPYFAAAEGLDADAHAEAAEHPRSRSASARRRRAR